MRKDSDYGKVKSAARVRSVISKTVVYSLLTLWGLIVLFPFYWMLLTSVKSYGAYNSEYIPQFFTLSPTVQNYFDAFRAVPLAKYFLNTIIFTVATTALMLIVIVLVLSRRHSLPSMVPPFTTPSMVPTPLLSRHSTRPRV